MENNFLPLTWKLRDLEQIKKNNLKVFSCFHCAGGSTMGYKLAGYDVLGGVEIDPEMMAIYRNNHKPKYSYLMGVQDFKLQDKAKLPDELFNLDILDGSPPCSSFSMSGKREKKWGKASKFREGQAIQNLDDLFFDFIDVANMLRPKVVVAENVKGLITGNAKGYVKQIFENFKKIGYSTQLFLLNSAYMGVPQTRERVFFIANRIDKKINLKFDERPIPLKVALKNCETKTSKKMTESTYDLWKICKPGNQLSSVHPKKFRWNWIKLHPEYPSNTLASTDAYMHLHWSEPRTLSDHEILRIQTFPEDFNAKNIGYICGMSVPPFMMHRIANQIAKQFFDATK